MVVSRIRKLSAYVIFLAALLAVAACSNAGAATGTPPPPDGLRQETISILRGLSSVDFQVTHPVVPTDMGGGLTLSTVTGSAVFPDKAEMSADGAVQRVAVKFGIVQIGDTTYFQGPIGDTWREVDPSTLPFNFRGMNTSVADALENAANIKTGVGEKIDGQPTFTLTGSINSNDLKGLVPGAADGLPLDIEVWVQQSDGMPLRVTLKGSVIDTDPSTMVRQLDLSGFNKPVTIEPPI